MPFAPNQQFHEYRIVRTLGQGGFDTVYLAQDTLLDRRVAIKELTVTMQTNEQAFKRFMQEACTAGGLNQPNYVRCAGAILTATFLTCTVAQLRHWV